jgi:hypothetical protein
VLIARKLSHKGDDLSKISKYFQVAFLVFIAVWYDNLRAGLG